MNTLSRVITMRATTTGALRLSIDADVLRRFPGLRVGALIVTRLDRATASLTQSDARAAWTITAEVLAKRGITRETISTAAAIDEWRQAFAACGVSPATYTGRVESAVRRALASGGSTSVVPLLELCRAITARHMAPLSGHDLDSLPSRVLAVRAARPASDWFLPLGALPSELPLDPSTIVYAAGTTVLAWSFNHRDSRQTCVHTASERAVFFSEAITAGQAAAAADALDELRRIVTARGAHAGTPVFAHRGAPDVALPLEDGTNTAPRVPRNPGGETTP